MLTVDALAQEIRRVDGNHSLGAGTLAEALMPFISAALSIEQTQPMALKKALMAAYEEFNRIACEDITETRTKTDVLERVHFFANRGATDIRAALSTTRIADSAEAGGSATLSKGCAE